MEESAESEEFYNFRFLSAFWWREPFPKLSL